MSIKFNNTDLPSFVKVNDIKVSMLPPITQNTIKINGKAGLIDFGNEIGERNIEVAFTIIADSPMDLKRKIRIFSEYLYTDEAKQLVLLDESDKYYMAKVSGDTDIDEIINVGQGTVTFICTDPYAYSIVKKEFDFNPISTSEPVNFVNEGSIETFPKMEFTFLNDTSEFTIISDDQYMSFGNPVSVDTTTFDPLPLVLRDPMDNVGLWNTATSVYDGTVAGSFWTNGYSFLVTDFGTDIEGWHGASGIRSLTKELQDFKVTMNLGLVPAKTGELGRILMTLLDVNGNRVTTISLRQGHQGVITPYMEAFVGGATRVHDTYGPNLGYLHPFYGDMGIDRVGNRWHFYWIQKDYYTRAEGKRWDYYYVDINNTFSQKVASVQIAIMAHGYDYSVFPPVSEMYIQDITAQEHVAPQEQVNNLDPYVFHNGDVLTIDSETAEIRLNGEVYYSKLDPSSQFITLNKGANGLTYTPVTSVQGKINYKERWM